jgi:two-component system chemotaxis sensor kinase CheA
MTAEGRAVDDEVYQDLLTDFLDESDQLLERLNERLLTLDELVRLCEPGQGANCDLDFLNDMFRSAHSLKGLSAMLGLSEINSLTHRVENVFDAARNSRLVITANVVEVMFRSVDRLVGMVDTLREPDSAMPGAEDLAQELGAILGVDPAPPAASVDELMEAAVQTPADRDDGPPQDEPFEPASPVGVVEVEVPNLFEGVTDEEELATKYLSIFVDETAISLDAIENDLTVDESRAQDWVRQVLVQAHKVKGSAAAMGLRRAAKLAHLMEDLLQEIHASKGEPTSAITDALVACVDALRCFLETVREGRHRQFDFNPAARVLWLARGRTESAAKIQPEIKNQAVPRHSLANVKEAVSRAVTAGEHAWLGRVKMEPGLALAGLKAELLLEKLGRMGEICHLHPELKAIESANTLDEWYFALLSETEEAALRSDLNIAGVACLELESFRTPGNSRQNGAPLSPPPTRAPAPTPSRETAVPAPPAASSENTSKPAETLRVDIERLDQLMNLAGQLVINRARLSRIGEKLKQVTSTSYSTARTSGAEEALGTFEEWLDRSVQSQIPSAERELLRSCTRQLQLDLAAIQNELSLFRSARSTVQELGEAVHQLQRVSDGIQKSVMDTRMVPIGPLFQRFKRVIRDITRENGKEIRLVIKGEKTELDKRMIDELGDPLIHMVRNSADHGIETPDIRRYTGKPASGIVTLDAYHRGNHIVIQVTDDGRGLDPAKIKAKALEKGILTPQDAEKLSDRQTLQLIWEPGFSTAEKITHISGRGMGMDIVRSKIEELNGKVELESTLGQGTCFTIRLPLTLAILPSLLAEVDGGVFAIPIESVVEIVSVPRPLETVRGASVAMVRNRVVSVVELRDVLSWNSLSHTLGETGNGSVATLVILNDGGREVALPVNHLLGEEDIVIKSLADNYRNLVGISGASILGDGRVALIVDPAAIVSLAGNGREAVSV